MGHRSLKLAAVLAVGLPLLAVAPAPFDVQLGKSEHKKLSKGIANVFEAKRTKKGYNDAISDLNDEIAKIEKKKKGASVLAMVDDLKACFVLAAEYKGSAKKGRVQVNELDGVFGDEIEYAVFAPNAYNKTKGPYPLVLCIPDEGEEPRKHLDEVWGEGDIRKTTILAVVGMPEDVAAWTQTGSEGKPGGRGSVLQVLGALTREYAIDREKIFISGHGAGVAAAATLASQSPHTFAGLIGRRGDMEETDVSNFANLPTFFSGGGSNVTSFETAAKEAGIENCTVKPDGTTADIAAWIGEQTRETFPAELRFVPREYYASKAYWLELEGFDLEGKSSIEGKIDRETNTIVIDGKGVSSIWVSFNDNMVDLDKPVKVVCNGVEHVERHPRNLRIALDEVFTTGDPARVVTARKRYDLGGAEGSEDTE